MPRLALALLLLVAFTARAEEPARVAGFAALPGADTLRVRYDTTGCFHSASYEFTFTAGAAPRVMAARLNLEWSETERKFVEASRVTLGDLALAAEDLRQLDALIAFYRTKPNGGCTSIDKLHFEQVSGGKVVAKEAFTDASCSVHERKGVLSLSTLLDRMQKK